MASLISSLAWVRRGVSLQHPVKYDLDEKELQRISALAKIELEDARTELERANKAAEAMEGGSDREEDWEDEKSDGAEDGVEVENGNEDKMDEDPAPPPEKLDPNDLSEYKLDEYDKEETETGLFSNIKGLTYYKSIDDDPYITLKDVDVEERDELEILPTDNLIVTAKTEDEISHLEIYVYDENEENLYIHHDIMLPSFPLCLEWLDFHPSSDASSNPTGSYIAVGTMEPEVEIWSLDTLDAIYPTAMLGRPDLTKAHTPLTLGSGKKKRKKTKSRALSTAYHVDAVLGLSWNKSHRNLLASASADTTIKLWDLTRAATTSESTNDESQGSLRSFQVHKDKVQCVRWNDKEPSVLLSGSYDRTVRTFDTRTPEKGLVALLGADVEGICWDPWEIHNFFVSLENGLVLSYDARTLSSDSNTLARSRFTLAAHDGAVSALDINPHIRGCMVTGGTDKLVKIWNITEGDATKTEVSLVTSRDLGVGRVFSAVWSPDDPLTVAAAGSTAKLQVWDVAANAGVRKTLGNKFAQASITVKERSNGGIIGVISDGEDDSEDDG